MNERALTRHFGGEGPVRLDRRMVLGMAEAGLLDHLPNYELENGVLVTMSPSQSPHGKAIAHLGALFVMTFGDRFTLASDTFLFLSEHEMRAPDIVVVPNDIDAKVFQPRDIALCVEISDETLRRDTSIKARDYARHGIPEYWVFDLPNRLLHIHREPGPSGYGSVTRQGWDTPVAPLCAPDAPLRPADQLDRVIR